jgi:hypothetical protein
MNCGSPEFAVFGTSCETAGITPGCGAGALGALYPQPRHTMVNNNTKLVFIVFSQIEDSGGRLATSKAVSVRLVLFSCKGNV